MELPPVFLAHLPKIELHIRLESMMQEEMLAALTEFAGNC